MTARLAFRVKTQNSGQRGRGDEPAEGPGYGDRWFEVPAEVVHEFVSELCAEHTHRGVEKMTGLSKETIRRYVERIGVPHRSTQKRFAELYLDQYPGGHVAKETAPKRKRGVWPLKTILPAGEENAKAVVDRLVELAKRHPDQVPPEVADQLREWLDLQLTAEYRGAIYDYRYDPPRVIRPYQPLPGEKRASSASEGETS